MLFVGHDWAEDHHDIAVIDSDGKRLVAVKVPEGASGATRLIGVLAELGVGVDEIVVGTETDRGLFIGAMVAGLDRPPHSQPPPQLRTKSTRPHPEPPRPSGANRPDKKQKPVRTLDKGAPSKMTIFLARAWKSPGRKRF